MRHQIDYDPEARFLFGKTSGTATLAGFCDYVDALAGHPELSNCVGIISDHRDLDLAKYPKADVNAVIAHVRNHEAKFHGMVHPIVVKRGVDFGVTRMYENMGDRKLPWKTHVCDSIVEARAVLAREQQ